MEMYETIDACLLSDALYAKPKDDPQFCILLYGDRLQISAEVDKDDLVKLQGVLAVYAEILALCQKPFH